MARVIIDGEADVVTVTTIENYTDDLLGVVPSLVFVRIIGTVARRKTVQDGNNFVEKVDTVAFNKILNVLLIREWVV